MTALRPCVAALVAAATALSLLPAVGAAAKPHPKAAPEPLRVLVSNDDGVKAPGIDALVQGLRRQPNVKVLVVAPAAQQSGTGGKTTPGTLHASRTTTASGYPAIAVDGYPADSVDYALTKVVEPAKVDLLISGINQGANLGPFVDLSGTVGAARAGAAKGLPALATSEGTTTITNFSDGVTMTMGWLKANRTKLRRGTVQNLNTPECSAGHPRGIVRATSTATLAAGINPFVTVDCNQTTPAGADEVTDYLAGFATLTRIPVTPGG